MWPQGDLGLHDFTAASAQTATAPARIEKSYGPADNWPTGCGWPSA